jgi:hypothetical protein
MRAATKPHEGRAKAEAERIENEQVIADLRAVMDLPAGRRFMWRTLAATGLYRSSYHPSALIHFNEGQRSIGLTLLAEITAHCPDQYLKMQAEAMDAERKAAERLAVDNSTEDRDNDD